MRLREHPGVKGKRDSYPFDPRLLKVDPNYNVRDLTTPDAVAKLAELKEQIRGAGVRTPLEVRMQDDDVFVVSGHRRLRAVLELIEEGEPIESVLVIHETAGTSEAERTLNLALHNSGEPLLPMEKARIVKRLLDFGWDEGQIAKRMGWKSKGTVANHLDMLALPEGVQAAVKKGEVSATLARRTVEELGPEETERLIKANAEQGKKLRPREVPRKPNPKAKAPKPAPAQPELPEPRRGETVQPPAPEPEQTPVFPQPDTDYNVVVTAEHFVPLADMTPPAPEPIRELIDEPTAPAPSHGLNGFIATCEPFAAAIEGWNLDEIGDEGTVLLEIKVPDAKRFSAAWNKATGVTQ